MDTVHVVIQTREFVFLGIVVMGFVVFVGACAYRIYKRGHVNDIF